MRMGALAFIGLATLELVGGTAGALAQPCSPHWSDQFPLVELDGPVRTLAVFDSGGGPALYAGGEFQTDSFNRIRGLARWDGANWQPTRDPATWGRCFAATVYDDGNGPGLYAVNYFGLFEKGYWAVGRYDGSGWTPIARTTAGFYSDNDIHALFWFDDGSGPALYAGGSFDAIDGVPARNIARWDGQSWSEVGVGFAGGGVEVLHSYDDGTGPALYAGGFFTSSGGLPARGIARWDGAAWTEVGGGLSGFLGACTALEPYDDGGGPSLFVGGGFSAAGNLSASCIIRWDGQAWRSAGEFHGMLYDGTLVRCLKVVELDDGPRLYAGGSFDNDKYDAERRVRGLALWDAATQSWVSAAPGVPNVFNGFISDIAVIAEHGKHAMYVGGDIRTLYGVPARHIARFDGQRWTRIGDGLDGSVSAIAQFDPGDGVRLYAAGGFRAIGQLITTGIASWDERNGWQDVGGGATKGYDIDYIAGVDCLAVSAVTGRRLLYAAGNFSEIGGVAAPGGFAAWDGKAWSIPQGMETAENIWAFVALHDPILGEVLYAAGHFQGVECWAQWTDQGWLVLPGTTGYVLTLAHYDDGEGPMLYAAGTFDMMQDLDPAIRCVARWDGAQWHDVGSPLVADQISALQVYDPGTGSLLYAAGQMDEEQFNSPFEQIAAWDGAQWSPVGKGLSSKGGWISGTLDLDVAEVGAGPELFACGYFNYADGKAARQTAKWNGEKWSPLDGGLGPFGTLTAPSTMSPFNDPEHPSVFFGGSFLNAADENGTQFSSGRIARWVGCPPCLADCAADGTLDILDFLCFQGAFFAGSTKADCDGNGALDLFDFLCFVNAFNAGC